MGLFLALGLVLAGLAACGTKGDPVPPPAEEGRQEPSGSEPTASGGALLDGA